MHRAQRLTTVVWLLAAMVALWVVATAMAGLGADAGPVPHITTGHDLDLFGGR